MAADTMVKDNPLAFWQRKVGDVITGFRKSMDLREIEEEENNNDPNYIDPRDLPSKIPVPVPRQECTPSPSTEEEDDEDWTPQPHVAPGWNISTKVEEKKASELPVPTRTRKPLLRSQSEFALKMPIAPSQSARGPNLHRRSSTTPKAPSREEVQKSPRRMSMPVKATVNYQNSAALAGTGRSPRTGNSTERLPSYARTNSRSSSVERRSSVGGERPVSANRAVRSNSVDRGSDGQRRRSVSGESPRRPPSPGVSPRNRPSSPGGQQRSKPPSPTASKQLPANYKQMNGDQPVNFRRQSSEDPSQTAARRQMRMQRAQSVNLDAVSPRSEEESPRPPSPGRRGSLQKVKYVGPPSKDRWDESSCSPRSSTESPQTSIESPRTPVTEKSPRMRINGVPTSLCYSAETNSTNVRMRLKTNPNARDANRRQSNAF